VSLKIKPEDTEITAQRTIRQSGTSTVITVPPELKQSLGWDHSDEVELTANWDTGELVITKVEG